MADAPDVPDYPFASRYLELDAGRMHYLDEGRGPALLFLHGNPTWSFYYRRCVSALRDRYRCVAPDLLGFGLSDHPSYRSFGYTGADHAETIDALIAALGLERFVLIVHEWGGPIGLDCVSRDPERLRALVAMNSWFWPVADDRRFRRSSYSGASFGRGVLSKALNIPVETMFTRHGRTQVSQEILDAYRSVQEDPDGRDGVRIFKRELVRATRWLQEVRDRQPRISGRPTLLVWGTDDQLFGSHELRTWEALFQNTRTVRLEGVGHYVCEEAPDRVVDSIAEFFDGIDRTT
jgi:haloalkane dehalogenase